MAENFNATTGQGLRDRNYAWTAAVYLYAQRLLVGRAKPVSRIMD
jgi:hypothetical protein